MQLQLAQERIPSVDWALLPVIELHTAGSLNFFLVEFDANDRSKVNLRLKCCTFMEDIDACH